MTSADLQIREGIAWVDLEPAEPLGWWLDDRFARDLEALVAAVGAVAPLPRGLVIRLPAASHAASTDADAAVQLLARLATDGQLRQVLFERVARPARALHELARLDMPVVTAAQGDLLGPALGVWLAGERRIAVSTAGSVLGLPELRVGLPPLPGTVARLVQLLGLLPALDSPLLAGGLVEVAAVAGSGLADEVVDDTARLDGAARGWLERAAVGGDRVGHGGVLDPFAGGLSSPVSGLTAALRARLRGAPDRLPLALLALAVEGARLDAGTAASLEARCFVTLATDEQAANLIGTRMLDPAADVTDDPGLVDVLRVAMSDEAAALSRDGVASTTIRRAALHVGIAGATVDSWRLRVEPQADHQTDHQVDRHAGAAATRDRDLVAERLLLAAVVAGANWLETSGAAGAASLGRASVTAGFPEVLGGAHRFLLAYPGGAAAAAHRRDELRSELGRRDRT